MCLVKKYFGKRHEQRELLALLWSILAGCVVVTEDVLGGYRGVW